MLMTYVPLSSPKETVSTPCERETSSVSTRASREEHRDTSKEERVPSARLEKSESERVAGEKGVAGIVVAAARFDMALRGRVALLERWRASRHCRRASNGQGVLLLECDLTTAATARDGDGERKSA